MEVAITPNHPAEAISVNVVTPLTPSEEVTILPYQDAELHCLDVAIPSTSVHIESNS